MIEQTGLKSHGPTIRTCSYFQWPWEVLGGWRQGGRESSLLWEPFMLIHFTLCSMMLNVNLSCLVLTWLWYLKLVLIQFTLSHSSCWVTLIVGGLNLVIFYFQVGWWSTFCWEIVASLASSVSYFRLQKFMSWQPFLCNQLLTSEAHPFSAPPPTAIGCSQWLATVAAYHTSSLHG